MGVVFVLAAVVPLQLVDCNQGNALMLVNIHQEQVSSSQPVSNPPWMILMQPGAYPWPACA
jgi:hypothetical protein